MVLNFSYFTAVLFCCLTSRFVQLFVPTILINHSNSSCVRGGFVGLGCGFVPDIAMFHIVMLLMIGKSFLSGYESMKES